eukprot:Blabericola_migrator_1__9538@NODE_5192_length_850_cov_4_144317_g3307_i0_p1_GENE_NODE_5192_length_850_cov_4_144317_g3307_i0NODE_5192_length_850_cov_4_144317_g3307_i0_p1_ORF_typecomplete_len101_score11_68PAPA1/PF04795_12/0_15_NODE_5192_length_850_cov_4_144317_g3307_i0501803
MRVSRAQRYICGALHPLMGVSQQFSHLYYSWTASMSHGRFSVTTMCGAGSVSRDHTNLTAIEDRKEETIDRLFSKTSSLAQVCQENNRGQEESRASDFVS